MWVFLLDPIELWLAIAPVQINIHIRNVKLAGEVHFVATRSCQGEMGGTITAEELGQHETGSASAEDEDGGARRWGNAGKAVEGAGGGLDQSGIYGGEVLKFKDLLNCSYW